LPVPFLHKSVTLGKFYFSDKKTNLMTKATIATAVKAAEKWMTINGVTGVAQGKHRGKDCVVVLLSNPAHTLSEKIPTRLMGYDVVLQEVGDINAQ
jgi:hypothetical protein